MSLAGVVAWGVFLGEKRGKTSLICPKLYAGVRKLSAQLCSAGGLSAAAVVTTGCDVAGGAVSICISMPS